MNYRACVTYIGGCTVISKVLCRVVPPQSINLPCPGLLSSTRYGNNTPL